MKQGLILLLCLWCAGLSFGGKAKVKQHIDTVGVLPYEDYYYAADHLVEIAEFVNGFADTSRYLEVADIYSGLEARTFTEAQERGYSAARYDVSIDPLHNVLTKAGFWHLLTIACSILPFGFAMLGPPCSLWIFLSSSIHKRSPANRAGDYANLLVNFSNMINERPGATGAISSLRFLSVS
jgi:hypothetical protein